MIADDAVFDNQHEIEQQLSANGLRDRVLVASVMVRALHDWG
jgi:hypothetical protein